MSGTLPHKVIDPSKLIKEFRETIIGSSELQLDKFYRCEFCDTRFSHVSDFIEHFDTFAGGCLGRICAYFSLKQVINSEHPLTFRCVFEKCSLCIKKSKGYQKEFHRHLKSHGMDLVILYTKTRLEENGRSHAKIPF